MRGPCISGVCREPPVCEVCAHAARSDMEMEVEIAVASATVTEGETTEIELAPITCPQTVPDLNEDCPICLESLGDNGGTVAELQCGHGLCHPCLKAMLSARLKSCPFCRLRLPATTEHHRPSIDHQQGNAVNASNLPRQMHVSPLSPFSIRLFMKIMFTAASRRCWDLQT